LSKLKTERIVFTNNYYQERKFWEAILVQIPGVEELIKAVKSDLCWDDIKTVAKKHKKQLLAYKHWIPAVKQAVELFLQE
jgi:hypothetical protein